MENQPVIVTLCIGFLPIKVEVDSQTYKMLTTNEAETKRALGAVIRVIELIIEEDRAQQRQVSGALKRLNAKLTEAMGLLGASDRDAQNFIDSGVLDLAPVEIHQAMEVVRTYTSN